MAIPSDFNPLGHNVNSNSFIEAEGTIFNIKVPANTSFKCTVYLTSIDSKKPVTVDWGGGAGPTTFTGYYKTFSYTYDTRTTKQELNTQMKFSGNLNIIEFQSYTGNKYAEIVQIDKDLGFLQYGEAYSINRTILKNFPFTKALRNIDGFFKNSYLKTIENFVIPSNIGSAQYLFSSSRLSKINKLEFPNKKMNCYGLFDGCYGLTEIDSSVKFPKFTTGCSLFWSCSNLQKIQADLDFSEVGTDMTHTFNQCNQLEMDIDKVQNSVNDPGNNIDWSNTFSRLL